MRKTIIAAMASNRVIGRDNDLPWRMPADFRRFKRLTQGHHLLMGRKTFESLKAPLPGRQILVLTRRQSYSPPGVHVAHTLEEAWQMAAGDDELFIAGGEEIYRQTMDQADRLQLTLIHQEFAGDTFFPEFDLGEWDLVSQEDHEADAENPYPYSFVVYEKRRPDAS